MDAETAALFPDSFEDSALGPIPTGWVAGQLADLASLNPETWSKSNRPETLQYVDLSNTKRGRIETIAPFSTTDAPSRAQRVLRPLDTIVGTVRPGNGSYALVTADGLTGSTGFAVLRPLEIHFAEFVYLAATSTENIDRLAQLADGGTYPAVRPEVVAGIKVAKPSSNVLLAFSERSRELFSLLAKNEHQSTISAEIRNQLLPKLLKGELRVGEVAA
jgi:type I restriction enzyme, S subunit